MARLTRRAFLVLAASAATQAYAGIDRGGVLKNTENAGVSPVRAEFRVDSVREVQQDAIPAGVMRVDYTSGVDGVSDWALAMPPETGSKWVVNLHGHGSRGDQLFVRPDIRQTWFPEFRKQGMGILAPNLRDNAWMSPAAAEDMHSLLEYARKSYGAEQFVFVGGSMGGTSTLIYACLHPDDVSGAVAFCPATDLASYNAWCRKRNEGVTKEIADAIEQAYSGTPQSRPEVYGAHSALLNLHSFRKPVFIAHGTADTLIPVSQPRQLIAAMGDAANVAYTEVPDGGHDSTLVPCFEEGFRWVVRRVSG